MGFEGFFGMTMCQSHQTRASVIVYAVIVYAYE